VTGGKWTGRPSRQSRGCGGTSEQVTGSRIRRTEEQLDWEQVDEREDPEGVERGGGSGGGEMEDKIRRMKSVYHLTLTRTTG
jgi:hypothetical protein